MQPAVGHIQAPGHTGLRFIQFTEIKQIGIVVATAKALVVSQGRRTMIGQVHFPAAVKGGENVRIVRRVTGLTAGFRCIKADAQCGRNFRAGRAVAVGVVKLATGGGGHNGFCVTNHNKIKMTAVGFTEKIFAVCTVDRQAGAVTGAGENIVKRQCKAIRARRPPGAKQVIDLNVFNTPKAVAGFLIAVFHHQIVQIVIAFVGPVVFISECSQSFFAGVKHIEGAFAVVGIVVVGVQYAVTITVHIFG